MNEPNPKRKKAKQISKWHAVFAAKNNSYFGIAKIGFKTGTGYITIKMLVSQETQINTSDHSECDMLILTTTKGISPSNLQQSASE